MPSFIGADVQPCFDTPRAVGRRQPPDAFLWGDARHEIDTLLSFWSESSQPRWRRKQWRGRRQHVSSLGRDYFRVCTAEGRIFDLYYDRRLQINHEIGGRWVLWREWQPAELADADNDPPNPL